MVVAVTAGRRGALDRRRGRGGRRGRGRRPDGQPRRLTGRVRPQHHPDSSVRGAQHTVTMPIYASPEQFMRDRSEYARKGIARGRSVVVTLYEGGVLFVAENHSPDAAQGQRDLRPDRVRRGRPVQRVREPAHRRHPAGRRARVLLRPPGRHRPLAGQRLRADPRVDLLRAPEAVRGGDLRRRGRPAAAARSTTAAHGDSRRDGPGTATSCTGSPTTGRSSRNASSW